MISKWGYTLSGEVVLPPQFDYAGEIKNDVALVWEDGNRGYLHMPYFESSITMPDGVDNQDRPENSEKELALQSSYTSARNQRITALIDPEELKRADDTMVKELSGIGGSGFGRITQMSRSEAHSANLAFFESYYHSKIDKEIPVVITNTFYKKTPFVNLECEKTLLQDTNLNFFSVKAALNGDLTEQCNVGAATAWSYIYYIAHQAATEYPAYNYDERAEYFKRFQVGTNLLQEATASNDVARLHLFLIQYCIGKQKNKTLIPVLKTICQSQESLDEWSSINSILEAK